MALHLRRRAAALAILASAGFLATPPAFASGPTGVAAAAHRGASGVAPENTLASMSQAIADRADYVEFDVRMTKDGVPVVLHDSGLGRTTNVETVYPGRSPWRVNDFTLAEVEKLDAGSWKAASYAHEPVPTLASLLGQVSQSPVGAFLEIKDPSAYGGLDNIGTKVFDTIQQQWPAALADPAAGRIMVQSFDDSFIQQFAGKYPDVPVGVIGLASPETVATFADNMQVYQGDITPDLTNTAHTNGITLGAWTVDDPATMTQLAQVDGVDSITSNYPDRLRSTLAADGSLYTGTSWPAKESATPTWSVSASGQFLNSPVHVTATLTAADGSPARWQWGDIQRWSNGQWQTVASRATNASGTFSATIPGTSGLKVRVVSTDDWEYPLATSPTVDVPLSKLDSTIRLSGPSSIRVGRSATLTIGWKAADGRAITGTASLYKRRVGGTWRFVRDVKVSGGYRQTTVYPRHTMKYKVLGRAGWWYTRDTDPTWVRVYR